MIQKEKGKYLSQIMTIIIEAMFAHPVYESNPDKIGWKWVNYRGGFPEPTGVNKYPLLFLQPKSI